MRTNILKSIREAAGVSEGIPASGDFNVPTDINPTPMQIAKATATPSNDLTKSIAEAATKNYVDVAPAYREPTVIDDSKHDIDVNKYAPYLPKGIFDNSELDDARARAQGRWEKVGNAFGKFLGTAGAIFGETMFATPYGIAKSITSGRFADQYDNPISQGYNDILKWQEEAFPNYYTSKESEAPLYSPEYWFTTNFLFDKLIKNAGYSAGALAAGSVIAKGMGAIGNMAMSGKFATEMEKVANLQEEGKTMIEALHTVSKATRLVSATQKFMGAGLAAYGEAAFEGIGGKQTMKDKLIKSYMEDNGVMPENEALDRIEKISDASANIRFGLNIPLLTIDNVLEFGRFLSGYRDVAKPLARIGRETVAGEVVDQAKYEGVHEVGRVGQIQQAVGEATKRAGKYIMEGSGKVFTARNFREVTKDFLIEAHEEGTQYALQKGTEDYYTRKYNDSARSSIKDVIASTINGLKDEYGTREGWENILLGGITGGLIGSPVAIKAIKNMSRDTQLAIDDLNKYAVSDIFTNRYDASVRSLSIKNDMDEAIKSKDVFRYKNLQWDNFKNWVDTRVKYGKFDDLMQDLNDLRHLPEEEFKKTFGLERDGNDKTAGQYIDHLVQEAKKLRELRHDVDTRFAAYDEGTRDRLFDSASNSINIDKRENQIATSLSTLTQGYITDRLFTPTEGVDMKTEVKEATAKWLDNKLPSLVDQEKVAELVHDLGALRTRRADFATLYRQAIDPKYREQRAQEQKDAIEKVDNSIFDSYRQQTDAKVANEQDREGLLTSLRTDRKDLEGKKKYTDYLDKHIQSIETELDRKKDKESVADAKAISPVVENVPATSHTPTISVDGKYMTSAPSFPPPPTVGAPIKSISDFQNGRLYKQAMAKARFSTPDAIADAINDLEGARDAFKEPELNNFVANEIDRLKAKLEPETSPEAAVLQTLALNEEQPDVLDIATSTVEVKEKAKVEPTLLEIPAPNSANVYIANGGQGDFINGVVNTVEMAGKVVMESTDEGDLKIVGNEKTLKLLLNSKFSVGDEVGLVIEQNNHYGENSEGKHTSESLPIKITKGDTFVGYVNNLNVLEAQVNLALKVGRMRVTTLVKLTNDAGTDRNTAKLAQARLFDTVFRNPTDIHKGYKEIVKGFQDNYEYTKKIRDAVWEQYSKNKEVKLVSKVTKKTFGSNINAKKRNVADVLGENVKLWTPIPSRAGDSTQMQSFGKDKRYYTRNSETQYTNLDEKYNQGQVYVMIKGANGDEIPTVLVKARVGNDVVPMVKATYDLLELLKSDTPLDSQAVTALRDQINEYISVSDLRDESNNYKIHADKIEIADGDNTLFLYTRRYNEATKTAEAINGFNLAVVDKDGVTAEVVNSENNQERFIQVIGHALAIKYRNVDFKKLEDESTEYNGQKNYKNWLFNTAGLFTDVGWVLDKEGNRVSNISPVGKANLVLSIDSDIKEFEAVPTVTNVIRGYQGRNSVVPDDRDFNYFTLSEKEAHQYGSIVEWNDIDITDFFTRENEEEYQKMRDEFAKVLNKDLDPNDPDYFKKEKYFDILDNSPEGMEIQNKFWAFLRDKRYKGFSTYSAKQIAEMKGKEAEYDNKYIVAFSPATPSRGTTLDETGGGIDFLYAFNPTIPSAQRSIIDIDSYGLDNDTTKANNALDGVIKNTKVPLVKETAVFLRALIGKNNVEVKYTNITHIEGKRVNAFYSPTDAKHLELKGNTIYISRGHSFTAEGYNAMLVHEVLHSLTSYPFNTLKKNLTVSEEKFVTDMTALYSRAVAEITKTQGKTIEELSKSKEFYGLRNVEEFITEINTEPKFIELLKGIDVTEEDDVKEESLWDRIVSRIAKFIKELFGIAEVVKTVPIYNITTKKIKDFISNTYSDVNRRIAPLNGNRMLTAYTFPTYSRPADAHYTNVMAGIVFGIIMRNPDVSYSDIAKGSAVSLKEGLYNTLIKAADLGLLKDEEQARVFREIAESINDKDEDGKWDYTKKKDEAGWWKKVRHYIDKRLGYTIEAEDIDIGAITENFKDWDDTRLAEVSSRNTLSNKIKVMLMTTPKLATADFEVTDRGIRYNADKSTISGIAEFLDYDTVYPYILRNMIGSYDANEMLSRLDRIIVHDPSLIRVKHLLEGDSILLSDWFRQFSLQLPRIDYVQLDTDKEGKVTATVDRSNKSTDAVYMISNKWIEGIKSAIEAGKYDAKFQSEYNVIEREFESKRKTDIESAVKILSTLFNKIGIGISAEVITNEINAEANLSRFKVTNADGTINISKTQGSIIDVLFAIKLKSYIKPAIFGGRLSNTGDLNYLASLVQLYHYDAVEGSYLTVEGKTVYSAMLPNYISRFFQLTQSDNPRTREVAEAMLRDYGREGAMGYSNWIASRGAMKGFLDTQVANGAYQTDLNTVGLNTDFTKNFTYSYLDGTKRLDTREARTYTGYSDNDWRLMKMYMYLKGGTAQGWVKVPFLSPSDSGNQYFLQVPKIALRQGEAFGGTISSKSDLWKAVFRTVIQEIRRMQVARDLLFEVAADGSLTEKILLKEVQLQRYYHYKDVDKDGKPIVLKNGMPTGEVFKFHNIPSLNKVAIRDNGVIRDSLAGEKVAAINKAVTDFITKQLEEGMKNYAQHEGTLVADHNGIGDGSFKDLVAEYVLNQYIANVEMANYFYGSMAEYKSATDTNKRAKEVSSPGNRGSRLHTGETYRAVTIKDSKLRSKSYESLINAVKAKVMEEKGYTNKDPFDASNLIPIAGRGINEAGLSPLEKNVYDVVGSYLSINAADAQGYMTMSRWRNVMKDYGRWNEKVEAVYNAALDGDISSSELGAYVNTMKPFYYSRDYDAGLGRFVSTQVKFSLSPLVPALTKGTDLDIIRKWMERNGVDEMYFESAEKVGTKSMASIADAEGNVVESEMSKLVPTTYYNAGWQIQQTVPEHIVDEANKLGVQIAKLIVSNIKLDGSYAVNGLSTTGKNLINHYFDVLGANIKESATNLLKRLGVTDINDIKLNLEKVRDVLVEEVTRRNLSDNYLSALEIVEGEDGEKTFSEPLFTGAMTNKFESILTALFTNNITNQKFPGLHAVLLSDLFINSDSDTGVQYSNEFLTEVAEGKRSKRLQTKITAEGGLIHEVLVPAWSSKFFREGNRLNINDIPTELRKMIAYRIPTQAKNSMAYVEVVGFLPNVTGSIMVFPDDIVTQMGGDFDLDTIFIMTPTFRMENGVPTKVKYIEGDTAEIVEARYNRMYGTADKFLTYLDNVIAKEYDKLMPLEDREVDKLIDAIFSDVPLLFSDEEIDEILKEKGKSLDIYTKVSDKVKGYPTRAEFAKLSVEEQNPRSARDNRIFDLYTAILNSKEHIKEVVTPSEFKELTEVKNAIEKAYHEGEGGINPTTDEGQNVFRSKAVQGRALKGMGAIANSFTSVAQVAKIRLREDLGFVVKVDLKNKTKVEYRTLKARYGNDFKEDGDGFATITLYNIGFAPDGSYLNIDSKPITEVSSQVIGNVFDIVKEGFIPYINTYTFASWQAMLQTGVDPMTASFFYNQPIIRGVTDNYFDSLGLLNVKTSNEISDIKRLWQTDLYKLLKAQKGYKVNKPSVVNKAEQSIKNGRTVNPKRTEIQDLLKYNPDEIVPMNLEELQDQVAKETRFSKLTTEEKIDFLTYQLRVVEAFIRYKNSGEAISDGIKVFNTDRMGASPNMNVTRALDKNIERFNDYPREGARLLIGEGTAIEAIYPRFFNEKSTEGSAYKVLETYYDWANKLSEKVLVPLFIQQSKAFRTLVDATLGAMGKGFKDKDAQNIAEFGSIYMTSDLPFFSGVNVARIIGIEKEIVTDVNINIEDWKNLSVANKVILAQEIMKERLQEDVPHILNYLTAKVTKEEVERNKFQTIEFTNPAGDAILDDHLTDSFRDLWNSNNPKLRDLAEDLVLYNFVTTGGTFTQQSFAKIIPSDIRSSEYPNGIGLSRFLRNKQKDSNDTTGFFTDGIGNVIDKYIRNHWYDKSIVPIARTEYIRDSEGKIQYMFHEESQTQTPMTKGFTPVWRADAEGIIAVSRGSIGRVSSEIRKAHYIRVRNILYHNFVPDFGTISPEDWEKVPNIYYYPVSKLGNNNLVELGETSVLPDNNPEKSADEYRRIIEKRLGIDRGSEDEGDGGIEPTTPPVVDSPVGTITTAIIVANTNVSDKEVADLKKNCK